MQLKSLEAHYQALLFLSKVGHDSAEPVSEGKLVKDSIRLYIHTYLNIYIHIYTYIYIYIYIHIYI